MNSLHQPTAKRTNRPIPLHERLQQLNRDLSPEQPKSFEYLFAVHSGLRIKVCVFRNGDAKFFATCSLGNRSFREQGFSPSEAFNRLTIALRVHIATRPSAERQRLLGGAQ